MKQWKLLAIFFIISVGVLSGCATSFSPGSTPTSGYWVTTSGYKVQFTISTDLKTVTGYASEEIKGAVWAIHPFDGTIANGNFKDTDGWIISGTFDSPTSCHGTCFAPNSTYIANSNSYQFNAIWESSNANLKTLTVDQGTLTPSFNSVTTDYTVTLPNTASKITVNGTTADSQAVLSITPTQPMTLVPGSDLVTVTVTAPDGTTKKVYNLTINVSHGVAMTPAFSPVAGTYTEDLSVSLSSTTADATIYYTTDGSTPTTSSLIYPKQTGINILGNGTVLTIKAIATAAGYANSGIASAAYTISYAPAPSPIFIPSGGTYSINQNVEIYVPLLLFYSIYYTTDGSTPTTSSTLYNNGLIVATVNPATTIKAIVVPNTGSDLLPSAVGTATYTSSP